MPFLILKKNFAQSRRELKIIGKARLHTAGQAGSATLVIVCILSLRSKDRKVPFSDSQRHLRALASLREYYLIGKPGTQEIISPRAKGFITLVFPQG